MRRNKLALLPWVFGLAVGMAFADSHQSKEKIAAVIQDKVYHAKVYDHGQVQVAYDGGVARLTGTVDSLGVKQDAERAARKVDGVTRVENKIQVNAEDVSERQILEQARKQIVTYYAYGIFDHIELAAQGSKLSVRGQVSQPFKRNDIGNFLTRVKGVAELENNLEVLPTSLYDDRLRIAIAWAIFNDPNFVYYSNRAVAPIHIIVKNGNVTLEGVVGSQLDRIMAANHARFAATFFSLTNNLRVERS